MKKLALLFALCLSAPLLSGCAGMVIGGAASAGVAAAEERGFGGALDDTKILTDINRRLFERDETMFRKVTLNLSEGRVMMTGVLPTHDAVEEAVRLAWQAPGVREIYNDLQVGDIGAIDFGRDVVIANKMRSRLMFDKEVRNINYQVDVVNGIVFLIGIAQAEAERQRVIDHARDIENVRQVVDHILLKDDPRRFTKPAG